MNGPTFWTLTAQITIYFFHWNTKGEIFHISCSYNEWHKCLGWQNFHIVLTDTWSWSPASFSDCCGFVSKSKQPLQLLRIICSSRFGSANTNIVSVAVPSFGAFDRGSAVPWEWDHERAWTLSSVCGEREKYTVKMTLILMVKNCENATVKTC